MEIFSLDYSLLTAQGTQSGECLALTITTVGEYEKADWRCI